MSGMDLARRVAELFAGDVPLEGVWEHFCALVSDSFRARRVVFALRDAEGDRIVRVLEDGVSIALADTRPSSEAALARVLDSGRFMSNGNSMATPLTFGNELVGALSIEGLAPYEASEAALLESCALFVAARIHDELTRRESDRYHALAYTDALTEIWNRRKFDEALSDEWKRASRARLSLAIVMLDIDYFKVFNDTYGHQAGDRCLQAVARALRGCVSRPGDVLARYGGEEFVTLLPATTLEGAIALAERFRSAVAGANITHGGSSLGIVSLSLGAAAIVPERDGDAHALLALADESLYRAKEAGRNRVVAGTYASAAEPAQRTAQAARTNLPALPSPTIGRAEDCRALHALIDAHALVTVIGVGGSGKTRVAVTAAGGLTERFEDGVWFVDLSSLAEPELLPVLIGTALSMHVPEGSDGIAALARALRRRSLLLVLDNCEHLIEPIGTIAGELLDACPELRILATSRVPLGRDGEAVYRLPLLELPPEDARTANEVAPYDAVALFVERAKNAKPSFMLTDANAPAVAQICRHVDGIALGLELTAPRIAVVSAEQLAQRLAVNLAVVSDGRRTALPRHQTMHALIAWSYDLLAEKEQRLFRRLATFAGGWTLESASGVCADDDLDPFDLFDVHALLVNASLIVEDASAPGVRFRLLEPVREYARARLADSGEQNAIAERHAAYFAQCARAADETFYTTPSQAWFNGVQTELGNYRAALAWSFGPEGSPGLGAEIAGSLSWFFYYLSPAEGVRWIRSALASTGDAAPARSARLHLGLAPLYGLTPAEKRASGERAIALYRTVDDPLRLSHALRMLGLTMAWYFAAERSTAIELIAEAESLARRLDDPIAIALVLQARSQVLDGDDTAGRKALKEEAYRLLSEHGNDRQVSVVLTDLSEGAFAEGNYDAALAYGRDALRIAQSSGSRNTMLCAGINLMHYAAAVADWTTAYEVGERVLRWAQESQATEFVTYAMNALACSAAGTGDLVRSARLFGFCNARFGTLHAPRHDGMCEDVLYRRTMEQLRSALDAAELERALAEGAELDEDAAVAQARAMMMTEAA